MLISDFHCKISWLPLFGISVLGGLAVGGPTVVVGLPVVPGVGKFTVGEWVGVGNIFEVGDSFSEGSFIGVGFVIGGTVGDPNPSRNGVWMSESEIALGF